MLRRLIVFLVVVISLGIEFAAASDDRGIVIEKLDGSIVKYSFKQNPIITFNDTDLYITADGFTCSFPFNSLNRYYFSGNESSLGPNFSYPINLIFDGNNLQISANKENENVRVFSLEGKLLVSGKTDKNGTIVINFEEIPAGVYVIEYMNTSTKIVKK